MQRLRNPDSRHSKGDNPFRVDDGSQGNISAMVLAAMRTFTFREVTRRSKLVQRLESLRNWGGRFDWLLSLQVRRRLISSIEVTHFFGLLQ
jgi:hypothetical protein